MHRNCEKTFQLLKYMYTIDQTFIKILFTDTKKFAHHFVNNLYLPYSASRFILVNKKHKLLLYSRRFSHYSAPIHWLVHGHMTSNNETVSHQMPWAGNIAKTMTSNGKQFTVTRQMLTAVASDGWNLSACFKFCFCFVLLYNKSQWILFPSNLNVPRDEVEGNIEILGKQNSLFPKGPAMKWFVI